VLGRAHQAHSRGVIGVSRDGFAIGAVTTTGFAGVFEGDVFVAGNFTVTGAKSAAIRHPDGTIRRLYCIESPEPWFEDFGRASLVRGSARVRLDAAVSALIGDNTDYHVFLSPEGDCAGLYVSNRHRDGFDVRECGDGTADLLFSYRLAFRRGDLDLERMPEVEMPEPVAATNLLEATALTEESK